MDGARENYYAVGLYKDGFCELRDILKIEEAGLGFMKEFLTS